MAVKKLWLLQFGTRTVYVNWKEKENRSTLISSKSYFFARMLLRWTGIYFKEARNTCAFWYTWQIAHVKDRVHFSESKSCIDDFKYTEKHKRYTAASSRVYIWPIMLVPNTVIKWSIAHKIFIKPEKMCFGLGNALLKLISLKPIAINI